MQLNGAVLKHRSACTNIDTVSAQEWQWSTLQEKLSFTVTKQSALGALSSYCMSLLISSESISAQNPSLNEDKLPSLCKSMLVKVGSELNVQYISHVSVY